MFGTHPSRTLVRSRRSLHPASRPGVHARTPTLNLKPASVHRRMVERGLYLLPRFTPICTASTQSSAHMPVPSARVSLFSEISHGFSSRFSTDGVTKSNGPVFRGLSHSRNYFRSLVVSGIFIPRVLVEESTKDRESGDDSWPMELRNATVRYLKG